MFLQDSNKVWNISDNQWNESYKLSSIQTIKNNIRYGKHFFCWSGPCCMCSCAWVLPWRWPSLFKITSFLFCQILVCVCVKRLYWMNTNYLRPLIGWEPASLKKTCTCYIRGDNFSDSYLVVFFTFAVLQGPGPLQCSLWVLEKTC